MEFYRVLHDFVVAIRPGAPQRIFYAHADAIDTWIEIRGYGHWNDEGVLRGRWIWAHPNLQGQIGESGEGVSVDTSTMPAELPSLTVDQLNMRIARPFLCKHKSGRWVLYDPIRTDPAERVEVARAWFGISFESSGGTPKALSRHTRRRAVGRVLYQQNTRRARLVDRVRI